MWKRSENGEYLYTFEFSEEGYTLVYTDLHCAYKESLTRSELVLKAEKLDCPFDLSNPLTFLETMAIGLEKARFNENVSVDFEFTGVPFKWVCQPLELPSYEVVELLATLTRNMFEVVNNISSFLETQRNVIIQKNSVIDGLSDSVQRKVWYRVPSSLVKAFSERSVPELPKNIDLVNHFWPQSSVKACKRASLASFENKEPKKEKLESIKIEPEMALILEETEAVVKEKEEEESDATIDDETRIDDDTIDDETRIDNDTLDDTVDDTVDETRDSDETRIEGTGDSTYDDT